MTYYAVAYYIVTYLGFLRMSTEKYLAFPYALSGGLVNLLMELEIRVGLAHLSGRTLVSPNKMPCQPQWDDHIYKRYRSATMMDMFDFPVKHISITKLYKTGFDTLHELDWRGQCASQAYYIHGDESQYDAGIIESFRETRQHQWTLPDNDADTWVAIVPQRTFCNYAYFFLAPESMRKNIRTVISRIQPKSHYLNLAKTISRDLKRFNAIHVRRGDFKSWWVSKPTPQDILGNIEQVLNKDKPLVILTDNSQEDDFFYPIVKAYPNAIFLDTHIEQEYKSQLASLPQQDATIIALLSLLVAVDAETFAGSAYSTFTGYIHRRRMLRDKNAPMLFVANPFGDAAKMVNCEFQPQAEGPFSWNRLGIAHSEESRANAWYREWPEAAH